jgi:hypothetical protein
VTQDCTHIATMVARLLQDLRSLVEGFTAPALAAALRDRESTLQMCAHLLSR